MNLNHWRTRDLSQTFMELRSLAGELGLAYITASKRSYMS